MGPKKKEKKEKKGKKEKEKPKKTLKSEYVTRIAERNALLAAAKKRIEKVEDVYFATEKRYEQTQADMADIIRYLQHEIEENELEIAAFAEKIAAFKEEIKKIDKYYQSIFKKMEEEYEEKEKALRDQIQQNEAKLSALDESKHQRDEYLKKRELLHQKMQEMEARHRQEIYEADKQAIIKQDTMQKEMELNLTKLAQDFRQATDIAIGETTNTLIRENIALGNMLTCTQETLERARDTYHKVFEREKQYRYNAELFDQEHYLIQRKYTKQVNRIQNLLKSQEELDKQIKMCEKLIRDNRRLHREIAEKECILKEKVAELNYLTRVLVEKEEIFNAIKNTYNLLRKCIIDLETSLFEAAKKAKRAVDVENITRLVDEDDETIQPEMNKEEHEEMLIEFKFKTRETSIDEIIEKLRRGLQSDSQVPLKVPSSVLQMVSSHEIPVMDTKQSNELISKK